MTDILFVHPNASKFIYQGLANDHSAIEPPIWVAMLANAVRKKNYSTEILDAEVEQLTPEQAVKRIVETSAKIVCFNRAAPGGKVSPRLTREIQDTPVKLSGLNFRKPQQNQGMR